MAQNGKLGIVSEVARWARVYLGLYERVDSFEVAADEAGSLIPGASLFSITFPVTSKKAGKFGKRVASEFRNLPRPKRCPILPLILDSGLLGGKMFGQWAAGFYWDEVKDLRLYGQFPRKDLALWITSWQRKLFEGLWLCWRNGGSLRQFCFHQIKVREEWGCEFNAWMCDCLETETLGLRTNNKQNSLISNLCGARLQRRGI